MVAAAGGTVVLAAATLLLLGRPDAPRASEPPVAAAPPSGGPDQDEAPSGPSARPAEAPPPAVEATPDAPPASDPEVSLSRAPDDPAILAERVRARTVRIECARGLGSGWPLDPSSLGAAALGSGSLIVTNAHVVEDCGRDPVVVIDGRRHPGSIVGVDFAQAVGGLPPERDLALIETPLELEPFRVGDDVRIGHWVMAVGSPMGIDGTVTFGVVSNFLGGTILTNTDIFQGNSGGPLVNARGEVVGVNTAYFSDYESLAIAVDARSLCVRLLDCG